MMLLFSAERSVLFQTMTPLPSYDCSSAIVVIVLFDGEASGIAVAMFQINVLAFCPEVLLA